MPCRNLFRIANAIAALVGFAILVTSTLLHARLGVSQGAYQVIKDSAVLLVLATVLASSAWLFTASRIWFALLGLYTSLVIAAPFLVDHDLSEFGAFYSSIKPGMAVQEVQHILRARFPNQSATGWPKEYLEKDRLSYALYGTDGTWNSEYAVFNLYRGRVTAKEYWPD